MTIALAFSSAFMTPLSPANTLVATAGNYSFSDFLRIGLPLTLIVGIICVVMVPLIFPV
jgi:di/tricarboxylate transporter